MPWKRYFRRTQNDGPDTSALERRPSPTPDSHFVDVGGLQVHYTRAGEGRPALVLLHGSFLSLRSWRTVTPPLAELATVIAFDRPAFGLTARPAPGKDGPNPYGPIAQADLTIALLDRLELDQAVLVGHSAGGTVALLAAQRHPERVSALVLEDAMVYSGYAVMEFPGWLRRLLRGTGPLGPLPLRLMIPRLHDTAIRSFWYDKSRVTPDLLADYRQTLQMQHWDRALWELTLASHAVRPGDQLADVRVPVLVISGEHDRTVPTDESVRLAEELPDARLVVIPDSAHMPHEEQPAAFVQAMQEFCKRLT